MATHVTRNDVKNGRKRATKPILPALPLGLPQRPHPRQKHDLSQAVPVDSPVRQSPLLELEQKDQHNSAEASTQVSSRDADNIRFQDTPVSALSNDHLPVTNGVHTDQGERGEQDVSSQQPSEPDTTETNILQEVAQSELPEAPPPRSNDGEDNEDPALSYPFGGQRTDIQDYKGTSQSSGPDADTEPHQHPHPHRKSEAAPEVLANGHGRDYSVHVKADHKPNGSVTAQPPLPTVYEHLLFLSNSKQFCDTIVQINQPEQILQPSVHYVHAALLLRSERFVKHMPEFNPSLQARLVNLYPVRNIQPHAFEAALRFLYTDHILSAEGLFPRNLSDDVRLKGHLFDYIMSYWIAGVELDLEPIKNRAFDLLRSLVDWDVAELAIKEVSTLRSIADASGSTSPSAAALSNISNAIFKMVVQLFVEHLNLPQFKLDVEATSAALPPRFSQLEPNRMATNPALSSMVFGSLPSPNGSSPNHNIAASKILLNLDFADLSFVAEELVHYHGRDGVSVMQDVVDERERRRAVVLSNRSVSNKQRLSNSAQWADAGLREYIDGGQLKRERVGFLLPTK